MGCQEQGERESEGGRERRERFATERKLQREAWRVREEWREWQRGRRRKVLREMEGYRKRDG